MTRIELLGYFANSYLKRLEGDVKGRRGIVEIIHHLGKIRERVKV